MHVGVGESACRNGVAVGRMIVAYSGYGAVTNYEIAWVTVALQHLRAGDDSCGTEGALGAG
jgi:hypothetical protein